MQVSNVRLELHLITYRTRNKTMNAEVDPETLTPVRHLMLWKLLRCHRNINYCTPSKISDCMLNSFIYIPGLVKFM